MFDIGKITRGEKYTLVLQNEMGMGVSVTHLTADRIEYCSWAQYPTAVRFTFKPKRARNLRYTVLTPAESFAIIKGHVNINNELFVSSGDGVKRSKYMSCDKRWFTDAMVQVNPKQVIFSNERNF